VGTAVTGNGYRLPARRRPIRLIGLTGGIGTGKSTAAAIFARHGTHWIDADRIAREAVLAGTPAAAELRRAFGSGVFLPDGRLDRAALAERVFADGDALRRLNAIVHPQVERAVTARSEAIWARSPEALVVYDVPLLFETGIADRFDLVVVVYAPRALQTRRIELRDGLPAPAVRQRLAAQLDIEEKRRRADTVLVNTGTPADLERQVEDLLAQIRDENRLFGEMKGN
jgi:dephospho-CoA kinase